MAATLMTLGSVASLDSLDPGVALRLALLTHGGLAIARSANSRDLALTTLNASRAIDSTVMYSKYLYLEKHHYESTGLF